jgi:hypothetical protein
MYRSRPESQNPGVPVPLDHVAAALREPLRASAPTTAAEISRPGCGNCRDRGNRYAIPTAAWKALRASHKFPQPLLRLLDSQAVNRPPNRGRLTPTC